MQRASTFKISFLRRARKARQARSARSALILLVCANATQLCSTPRSMSVRRSGRLYPLLLRLIEDDGEEEEEEGSRADSRRRLPARS